LVSSVISPNNTYNVLVNGESDKTGSLLEDFEPAVNPPKEIDDAKDKKPADWVDEKKISDPTAKKVSIYLRFVDSS
jgi:Calreticulin family